MTGRTGPPEVFEPYGSNLYHYTRLATGLEHILMTGKIRMNPLSTMRDPRESQPWMPTIGGFGPENAFELEDAHRFAALLDDLNTPGGGIRSRIKVLSMTLDDTRAVSDWDRDLYDWGFAHPRLWEHYADRHRGICLCFDRTALTDRITDLLSTRGELIYGAVRYENADIPGGALLMEPVNLRQSERPADPHVLKEHDAFLFTKLADWETEMEFRFVLHTDNPTPVEVPFGKTLRAIIAGHEVSYAYDQTFMRAAMSHDAQFFRIGWINGRPRLAASPVEPIE